MDPKRSQQYNYSREALPVLFHSQTDEFYQYLDRDGLDFLRFWWDHVGRGLEERLQRPFEGVEFETFSPRKGLHITIVSLPEPREEGEMHYLAFISTPEKRFAWVRLPNTRVLGLMRATRKGHPFDTEIGDLTPRGLYVAVGPGPRAEKVAFRDRVLELVYKITPP